MRWPIIRVIWLRELRDQLRDRRTMFMIVVLPLLIYPLAGLGIMQFVAGFLQAKVVIGIWGAEHLPRGNLAEVRAATAWLTAVPAGPATGIERVVAAESLALRSRQHGSIPALVRCQGRSVRFVPGLLTEQEKLMVSLRDFTEPAEVKWPAQKDEADGMPPPARPSFLDPIRVPLEHRQVDALLVVPPDFSGQLERCEWPTLYVLTRPDDRSLLARVQLQTILARWQQEINQVRFMRSGLPPGFDVPFLLNSPVEGGTSADGTGAVFGLLLRIFPFVLVLWSLAGALYPAVDLCAGEKERGTMETLLISPAQREEIVWGKFLAIWVFSAITALLNLLSMAITSWLFGSRLAGGSVQVLGLFWCVVLLLPLSAFFSALCLAVGAYARSSKEGQYYLMPLFLAAMPLLFLTLAPGVELNPFYSMVPVTGVALLLQQLLVSGRPDAALWLYFVPVLAPMVIYGWLALRWAIIQFQREEVLFREAERLEVGLWLKRLLRDKETRPSAGQALFCFMLILGLSWFSLGLGSELLVTNVVRFLAFVATPTLMMAVMLTTQPRQSLALRLPPWWSWPYAVVLVLVLTPPLAELTMLLLELSPNLKALIEQYQPFMEWLRTVGQEGGKADIGTWQALLVFAWLPAVCEELTFRGFILTGLQRRFRPRTAVLLSSFLFSLLQMNVFQFLPTFVLGVVLGYLTTRCGSILPAMLFHLLYNTLLLGSALSSAGREGAWLLFGMSPATLRVVAAVCTPVAAFLLWRLTWLWPHPAYVAFLASDPGMEPPFEAAPRPASTP
jgi:sodium transport system permease protein